MNFPCKALSLAACLAPPKKVDPSKVVTSQARGGARWDELVKKYQFLEGS